MDVDDSSTLYLYFSDDGGKTFDPEPRVATKDHLERARRRQLCSTCQLNPWGTKCGTNLGFTTYGCYREAVRDHSCGSGWRVPNDCYHNFGAFHDEMSGGGISVPHCGCTMAGCICKKWGRLGREDWYCGNNKNAGCPEFP